MEWTEETVARLRGLWSEGLPTAEIGRRLGITKNAVIGKAHRLVLPPRPSPIPGTLPEARTRAGAETVAGPSAVGPSVNGPSANGVSPVKAVAPPAWSPPRSAPPRVEPPAYRRAHSCCWPLGEPGKPGFHFCDDAALPTKPYCARHADLAYVKVREKREEAA